MKSENNASLRVEHNSSPNKSKPTTVSLGKLQPQAVDLEEAVLGALMLEKEAVNAVIEVLTPECFYKPAHQEIFIAIRTLFNESEPVDLLTVTSQLRKAGMLDKAGGPYYITELTTRVNSAANIEAHARVILEQSIKRELIGISKQVEEKSYDNTHDVFDLLDYAEQELFKVSESNIRKSVDNMKDLMHSAVQELKEKKKNKNSLTGVPSGFAALDRVTSGWQKSDLVIFAARPSMGKTAFVISALRNAAVDHKCPVAMFSLEMSSLQIVNRMISSEAELEGDKIRKGDLKDYEWEQLLAKTKVLNTAPIFIDDTPGLSILELRAKARRLKQQHDIKLIIIDYLQLMSGDSSKNGTGNREQEISSISRALKNIAKELDVPVIALSQLNRSVETRGGAKKPQLADLRESGAIEQDADMVMFLYRPEYYGLTEFEDQTPSQGLAEVIIAKHRNGSLDSVRLKFIGKFTRFEDEDTFGGFTSLGSSDAAPASAQTFSSKMNEGAGNSAGLGGGLSSAVDDFENEAPPF